MKINTNSTDIASLLKAYAARQRTTESTDSDSSQSTASQAATALLQRLAPPDMGSSAMSLSASGQKIKNSIQRPEPTEEMKAAMDQVRTDFESISSADVDSLSEDDAKALLDQLIADMGALPAKAGASASVETTGAIDTASLTDSEVKDILEKIQEQLQNGPAAGGTPPPPPEMQGMMWGFDPTQLLGGSSSEDTGTTALSSTESTEMAQQLIDLLTESYDSSESTSSDYAAKLKESIAQMLEKQKAGMDDFASTLYSELDIWSNAQ